MFSNIEKKIKGLAKVAFIVGTLATIIIGIVLLTIELVVLGVVFILAGPCISLISSWFMYGFGELIEKTGKVINAQNDSGASSSAYTIKTIGATLNQEGIMDIPKRVK